MAKKEKKPETEVKAGVSAGDFTRAAMKRAAQEFGNQHVYVGSDSDRRYIGVPIPSLAMSWLINNTCWPLQSITQAGGPPKALKSALSFEIARWFGLIRGMTTINETEKKSSPTLMVSMIPPEMLEAILVLRKDSIEDWQRSINWQRDELAKYVGSPKTFPDFPFLTIVDSVTGVADEDLLDKINTEGAGVGKGFHAGPQVISQYLKSVDLLGYPWTLHLVNHEKINPATGQINRPGGLALDFHGAIDLSFRKGMTKEEANLFCTKSEHVAYGVHTKNVTVKTRNNSFGPDDRKLVVAFRWRFEAVEGGEGRKRQVSWFDWDETDARLCLVLASELKAEGFNVVKTRSGTALPRLHCEELGIPASDPVTFAEFGKHIKDDEQLYLQLVRALAIPEGIPFTKEAFLAIRDS